MSTLNATQSVPYGAGSAFITMIRKADGTLVDPPQALVAEGLQDVSWDDKNTLKESHGEGAYAVRVAGGKNSLSLSLTISELTGRHLNQLCYGRDVEERQLKIMLDRNGYAVPEMNEVTAKIINSIQLNLARIDSNTSVMIDGDAASTSTLETLPAGKYEFTAGGLYRFSAEDVKKSLVITYVSNGTTLETTLKVPKKLTFNISQHAWHNKMIKDTVTPMSRKPFNLTANAPDAEFYRASQNGIVVFNSAQTGAMTIDHNTDGVPNVFTKVAVLPAAAYGLYIDPPVAAVWTSNVFVQLKNDAGTAMTGVVAGETLAVVTTAPTSGEVKVDSKGYYLFAAADAADTVLINYTTDYQFIVVTPPDEGVFVRDLGVRTIGGIALTRVALTSPLSLEHNQYAVSENGSYYIDQTNGGDVLKLNYQYEVTGQGQTIVVKNNKIGEAPTLMIDLMYDLDGEMTTVSFERVKPQGAGIPTKQEDFAGMKFEFKAFANRETSVVYTVSTSV